MQKKNIAVLFGGVSNEYEVSLRSVCSVLRSIDRAVYQPLPIGITRQGKWFYYPGAPEHIEADDWHEQPCCERAVLSPDGCLIRFTESGPLDVELYAVIPVLHGKNGEDGSMQGLLQLSGIPFVGSGVTGSALCMDKAYSNAIFDYYGIPHCEWTSFTAHEAGRAEELAGAFARKVGYPVIVKPARAGSSVGVSKAADSAALSRAICGALRYDDKVVLERCVNGREIECAVLGYDELFVSGVGEILPPEGVIYTYDEKYSAASATGLVIPADLPEATVAQIRTIAARAYKALGCGGLSRVDFFLEDGRPLVNEINTLPGFTSISMYPKLMEQAGIPTTELITRLIELAAEQRK